MLPTCYLFVEVLYRRLDILQTLQQYIKELLIVVVLVMFSLSCLSEHRFFKTGGGFYGVGERTVFDKWLLLRRVSVTKPLLMTMVDDNNLEFVLKVPLMTMVDDDNYAFVLKVPLTTIC